MLLLGKLAALLILSLPHAGASEPPASAPSKFTHDSSCDRWIPAQGTLKAVVVMGHGLNLKPGKMEEMAQEFSRAGYEIFLPAFYGHCGENNNYLHVTWEHWQADAQSIFATAQEVARKQSKPLYLVAYSFSALIFDSFSEEMSFAKRVYFAPPLATHFWYRPLLFFAQLFPDFSLASRNLPAYRANERSNFRSLLGLHYFVEKAAGKNAKRSSTLAWVDPKDELVSAKGLADFASENFKLQLLDNQGSTLPKTFHHLIISKESLGSAEWSRVISESLKFFAE